MQVIYNHDGFIVYIKEVLCQYEKTCKEECKEECKILACIVKDLQTGKEQILLRIKEYPYARDTFKVYEGKKYLLVLVSFCGIPNSFAVYDLKRKRVILQRYDFDDLYITQNFLDGKTPFYCIEEHIGKGKCYFTIYNKNKPIAKVRNYLRGLYSSFYRISVAFAANWKITEDTRYIADVDNEEGIITFYRPKKGKLELVNKLQLDKNCLYETHLASCGNKFVILETNQELVKTKRYKRILLYDVNEKKVEYETRYYADTPLTPLDDKTTGDFLRNLVLYAHSFQESCFHIYKDGNGKAKLMPLEQWREIERQRKALNEVLKAFASKKPHTSPSLRI